MVDATLLNKGSVLAEAIGAGGVFEQDLLCVDSSTLVVQVQMTGGADGDLTATLRPFETDQATIAPIAVPVVQSVGPTHAAGKIYYYAQYDITALDKVRIRLVNNNAGAQTIDRLSWRLN